MLLPMNPRGPARRLLPDVKGQVSDAEISPDGRWIAYESDESGRFDIYVRPFPAVDTGRWQISSSGGTHPLWSRSGRELFFIAGDGMMTSVPIRPGSAFARERPVGLFPAGQYLRQRRSQLRRLVRRQTLSVRQDQHRRRHPAVDNRRLTLDRRGAREDDQEGLRLPRVTWIIPNSAPRPRHPASEPAGRDAADHAAAARAAAARGRACVRRARRMAPSA